METVKAAKEAVKVPKKPSKNSVQKKANSVEQELDNQEKRIDDELKASAAKEKKLVEQGDVMEGIHEQELEEQDARAGSELNDIGEVLLQTNTVVSAVEPQRSRVQAMNMRGRGGWDYDGRSWGHNGGRWQEQDEEEGEESRRPDGGEEREGDRYIEARHGHGIQDIQDTSVIASRNLGSLGKSVSTDDEPTDGDMAVDDAVDKLEKSEEEKVENHKKVAAKEKALEKEEKDDAVNCCVQKAICRKKVLRAAMLKSTEQNDTQVELLLGQITSTLSSSGGSVVNHETKTDGLINNKQKADGKNVDKGTKEAKLEPEKITQKIEAKEAEETAENQALKLQKEASAVKDHDKKLLTAAKEQRDQDKPASPKTKVSALREMVHGQSIPAALAAVKQALLEDPELKDALIRLQSKLEKALVEVVSCMKETAPECGDNMGQIADVTSSSR